MTVTYSIDHVASSVEDVSVEVAAKSEMTLQSTFTDPKTGDVTSTYVLASGDGNYPATVSYRSSVQSRSTGAIRRISMTFSTWATAADSVTGIDTKKPISVTTSFNIPADMTIELADMDDLIGNSFSLLFLSVTTKVRDTTWLQKLLYGIPQVK